jgi:hypothetical protein
VIDLSTTNLRVAPTFLNKSRQNPWNTPYITPDITEAIQIMSLHNENRAETDPIALKPLGDDLT